MKTYVCNGYFEDGDMSESEDGAWIKKDDLTKSLEEHVSTATTIINMTDNKHIQEMAANIADGLISLGKVENL